MTVDEEKQPLCIKTTEIDTTDLMFLFQRLIRST
jgi:hypothetical protein